MSLALANTFCIPIEAGPMDCLPRNAICPGGNQKVALAIPTLREGANVNALLERVSAALDPLGLNYEILVVDDESCDGTAEIVSAIGAVDSRVRLLVRRGCTGLSGAILHGWQHTDAPILGVMDADLQHPPELLPELVRAVLSGHDLVIGSRYAEGGGLGRWNSVRKLLSAAAVRMTAPIQRTGLRASDPMSGFFFVRRSCVDGIAFQQSGFKLLLEILVRGRVRSVEEIPFVFGRRYRGASKASFTVAFEFIRLLARLYRARFTSQRMMAIAALRGQEAD
jgi:dolichol-phosphate mannosyltransferase